MKSVKNKCLSMHSFLCKLMNMSKRNNKMGALPMWAAAFFWGTSFAFVKDALATLSPLNFVFWRFFLASLILYACFYKKINFTRSILEHGLLLGLLLSGVMIFQTIGLRYTTASTAAFITSFSVVLVAILESAFSKQWPSLYLIGSVFLAVIGIGIITLSNGFVINQGDIWVLLCAFSTAGYILFVSKASQTGEAFSLTFIQSLFVALIAGLGSLLTTGITVSNTPNVWIAIIYCGIFASFLAFFLQLHYQKYVSASKTATIFTFQPIFATVTAAIYLHEHLTLRFYLGAILLLIAVYLAEKHSRKKIILYPPHL